ncbi:MAG: FAD-binding protein [Rhodospirillales bacterium]|jgi:D-lactate dehydrogenase (cytochrome)|nr:FAD-binding protein [Rhodospirillales bacterium]MBT4041513.1 FAD-binding protein [Rhodospirillales bacterium]MBT4627518.1 FAD-binding protein [Rhodospirillales bacterium]MBT5352920.1 FAD-binding protein [Rhodospirillales bacterium]MBT5520206.1 FAD-binding protein [Rhodospirillales bacterium]
MALPSIHHAVDDTFIEALSAIVGERVSRSDSVREHHGQDQSYHAASPPDAVVFAHSTEEISAVVMLCAEHVVPIIAFGTGTSLEGHVAALKGGVCIDVTQMNEVLAVNQADMDVRVQPGVTRKQLNTYLRDTGLFFPVDPGADASIGGMTATRASGTNAVRYGTMRENVLSMTVVMADGRIVRTSSRSRKSAAGYDLTRLFVGSEGTLGVIAEITLRLHGIPEAMSAAVCSFDSMEGAVNTVIETIQCGVPIARIELLDEVQMDAINRYSDLDYPLAPTLFFEFHGSEAGVQEQTETVRDLADGNGGGDFQWATDEQQRLHLWQARHDAYYACLALRPGTKGMVTDVCVPISRLAESILETQKDIQDTGLLAPIVGHVGDGNFHLCILVDPDDTAEIERAMALNERLVLRAIAMDGTCTGEHGVGYGKTAFLTAEHGDGVSVMRAVKNALDPQGIMNPGKMIPGN